LHAASTSVDATTARIELFIRGPFDQCFANACRSG
jgi:hypothetical protein